MDDHEVHFSWPSTEPNTVIVTGTFDQWSSSLHLGKNESGFHGSIKIPWGSKITYKYVVDSAWQTSSSAATETDHAGNVNNVYTAPPKPQATVTNGKVATNGSVPSSEAKAEEVIAGTQNGHAGTTLSQLASDFVDTVAARDGTSSVLGYVASGLGAALQTTIGVDLINGSKEAVETPRPDAQFDLSTPASDPSPVISPSPETPQVSPSIAPVVPMAIIPVNSEENGPTSGGLAATPDAEASEVPPEPQLQQTEPAESPSTHTPLPVATPSSSGVSVTAECETVQDVVSEAAAAVVPGVIPAVTVAETSSEPPKPATTAPAETPAPSAPVVSEPTLDSSATATSVVEPSEPTKSAPADTPAPVESSTLTDTSSPPPAETSSPTPAETPAPSAPVASDPPTLASSTTASAVETSEIPKPTAADVPSPVEDSSPTPAANPAPSAPATPTKNPQHAFPASDTASVSSSANNSPSKFGTRKKRQSIFGKVKGLFTHDKEKGKK